MDARYGVSSNGRFAARFWHLPLIRALARGTVAVNEKGPLAGSSRMHMVPEARVELARCRHRRILSPLRLPIPPLGHAFAHGTTTEEARTDQTSAISSSSTVRTISQESRPRPSTEASPIWLS